MFKSWFCKHTWKVLTEVTTKSKLEIAKEGVTGRSTIPWQLADASRKYITTYTCTTCGKLKRFVEEI